MKELICKSGIDKPSFPQKIVIDKTEVVGETKLANEFNKLFINIGPQPLKRFEIYISKVNSEMENKPITVNELKAAFYSLETNKSTGYDDISYNVVKIVSGSCMTHYYIYLTYHLQVEYFQTA